MKLEKNCPKCGASCDEIKRTNRKYPYQVSRCQSCKNFLVPNKGEVDSKTVWYWKVLDDVIFLPWNYLDEVDF